MCFIIIIVVVVVVVVIIIIIISYLEVLDIKKLLLQPH